MKTSSIRFLACAAALAATAAFAETESMRPLLERGPLVLVEPGPNGKFGQATAIILIDAPVDKVWSTIVAFDKFKEFMPKVETSEIVRHEGNEEDVRFVIDVPGPDEDYTIRYRLDPGQHELEGSWVKGDLKGSHWHWKVEATPDGKTLLTHVASVKNFSSFAQSIEDDQQTITVGVNVSTVLATVKGIKKRAEGKP